jgi:hypothetical protein
MLENFHTRVLGNLARHSGPFSDQEAAAGQLAVSRVFGHAVLLSDPPPQAVLLDIAAVMHKLNEHPRERPVWLAGFQAMCLAKCNNSPDTIDVSLAEGLFSSLCLEDGLPEAFFSKDTFATAKAPSVAQLRQFHPEAWAIFMVHSLLPRVYACRDPAQRVRDMYPLFAYMEMRPTVAAWHMLLVDTMHLLVPQSADGGARDHIICLSMLLALPHEAETCVQTLSVITYECPDRLTSLLTQRPDRVHRYGLLLRACVEHARILTVDMAHLLRQMGQDDTDMLRLFAEAGRELMAWHRGIRAELAERTAQALVEEEEKEERKEERKAERKAEEKKTALPRRRRRRGKRGKAKAESVADEVAESVADEAEESVAESVADDAPKQDKKSDESDTEEANADDVLLCPITLVRLVDPVVLSDGHTYERSAIEEWLTKRHTSPITGLPLTDVSVRTNHLVRSLL